ncbi:hypothetical protein GOB57_09660 [Sinorhizobium meliloti]|nr:hypothetical protein [Sinorhizobium meliloti]
MSNHLVLAVLILAFSPSAALADGCDAQPFRLKVNVTSPPEVVDRSQDSRSLGTILSDSSLPGYLTQGVTRVDYTASYSTEYLSRRRSDGSWCSTVNNVVVDFGFLAPPSIYIASALPPGSCMYDEVMKHEYEHLRIARETLESGRKWITRALKEELSKKGGVGPTPDAANSQIERRVSGIVNKITSGLYAAARVKNLALDTPENYARLGKACR